MFDNHIDEYGLLFDVYLVKHFVEPEKRKTIFLFKI
jgi:hypothetical protein